MTTTTSSSGDDLRASLAAAGDQWEAPDDDAARERFKVRNDAMATWAMRKLAAVEARREEIAAIANAEAERITAWFNEQTRPLTRDARYFKGLLCEYALDVRHVEDRKSVTTPYGTVQTRESGGGWDVDDADALLQWAAAHRPELVEMTPRFRLADAKKALQAVDGQVIDPATGEVVPGVKVPPKDLTASVKLAPATGSR